MNKIDDASKKILGFKYQEMLALIKCLEAKDNTSIFLECYGDISDKKISVEVKHSINPNKKLINTHIDFWKTIYNCLKNFDTYKFYDEFILHTTADIKEDSIFVGWDEKTSKTKLNDILSIESTNTISKYIEYIKEFNQKDLENILKKFTINSNAKNAKEFYIDILCNHPSIINSLDEEYRKQFINSLLGYISSLLIESDSFKWEIIVDSFRENFKSYLKQYQIGELVFPKSDAKIGNTVQKKFKFVQELESIGYDEKIGTSFRNYIKAKDSQFKMISKRYKLSDTLDDFDDEIKEHIESNIITHTNLLKTEQDYDLNEKSRRFIDSTESEISMDKNKIVGVIGVKSYYPKGRIYHCIEEDNLLSCKLKVKK